MNKKDIRFAVIGAGDAVGPYLAAAVDAVPGAQLVALVDLNADKLAGVADRFPTAQTFPTQRDLHESGLALDAEIIAVPTRFHQMHIRAALAEGHAVMGEKPLTSSAAETRDVLAMAQSRGLELFGIGQRRLMVEEITAAVLSGRIGKVLSAEASWLRADTAPGFALRDPRGAFADLGVHQLKTLSAALGGAPVDRIMGLASRRDDELGEYYAHASLTIGDVAATIRVGWTLHPAGGEGTEAPQDEVLLQIVGERGTITTALPTYEESPEELARFRPQIVTRDGKQRHVELLDVVPSVTACREREVAEFTALLRDGEPTSLPLDEENIARAIDGFYTSAEGDGQQVSLLS